MYNNRDKNAKMDLTSEERIKNEYTRDNSGSCCGENQREQVEMVRNTLLCMVVMNECRMTGVSEREIGSRIIRRRTRCHSYNIVGIIKRCRRRTH